MEFVGFDDAAKLFALHDQKTQHMAHAPGRRLAHAQGLGQSDGGYALVGLEDEPKPLHPGTERQLGAVQRGPGRHRELEAAGAAGALVKTGPTAMFTHRAIGEGRGTPISTFRTAPPAGPDQGFQKPTASFFIGKRADHFIDGFDLAENILRPIQHASPRTKAGSHVRLICPIFQVSAAFC